MAPGAGSRAGWLLAAPSPAELDPTRLLQIQFTSMSLQKDLHQQLHPPSQPPPAAPRTGHREPQWLKSRSQTEIPPQIKDNTASTLQPLHFLPIKPAPTWLHPTDLPQHPAGLSRKTQSKFQQQNHSKKSSLPGKIYPETRKTWALGEVLVMGTAGGLSAITAIKCFPALGLPSND